MNCHGLANVNDKEGPCVKEGKFLIPEDIESHRFFCAVIPVLTPDCRIRILPWNYAPIRSSLPAFQPVCNMMQNPGAWAAHLKLSFSRDPLVWMTGFGLKATRGGRGTSQEDLHLLRPPVDCRLLMTTSWESGCPPKRTLRKKITWEPGEEDGRGGARGERAKLRWCFP